MGYYTGQIFEMSHPQMRSSVAGGPRVAHATWIDSTAGGLIVEPITVPLSAPFERVVSAR